MLSPEVTPARPRHREFEFSRASLSGRTILLGYRLSGGPDVDIDFTERLELPSALPAPDPGDPVVARLVDAIHRMFGVSYFKAAAPRRLVAPPVDDADADFWDRVYTEGLGEFYYTNGLDPRGHSGFPRGGASPPAVPVARPTDERAIVLVGGGKDSAVAREVVRHAGVPAVALSLGAAPWIARSVEAMATEHLVVRRHLDPRLAEVNGRGAYNGHVPISACIAVVSILVAYLGGYQDLVVANERTADEGNLTWNGLTVNHQWSKSFGFEASLHEFCGRHFSGGPRYFSVLRPLTELRIAGAFATHSEYFDDFTSCNGNFRQRPAETPARWCGRCPKCVFAYLMLVPYLSEGDRLRVFGGDFLDTDHGVRMLERLTGVRGFKPFECVGTASESRAALARLARQGRLTAPVATWYETHLARDVGDPLALWRAARASGGPHCIPREWETRLYAYLGARGA
jgi:hypothetical protein